MTRKQQDRLEELYLTLLLKEIKSEMYLKAYGLRKCAKVMICILDKKHGCDDQHWRNRAVHFFTTRSFAVKDSCSFIGSILFIQSP